MFSSPIDTVDTLRVYGAAEVAVVDKLRLTAETLKEGWKVSKVFKMLENSLNRERPY